MAGAQLTAQEDDCDHRSAGALELLALLCLFLFALGVVRAVKRLQG